MKSSNLTIGKVAKQAGVGIETLRFYERKGLIQEPARLDSGYRQYEPDMPKRIRFIKRAQDLGFTLKEVKELLGLRINPKAPCITVKGRAEAKIEEIELKVRDLNRMKRSLKKLAAVCSGKGSTSACPILDSFEDEVSHVAKN